MRYATARTKCFTLCIAGALLSGCGGSQQSSLPSNAATSQNVERPTNRPAYRVVHRFFRQSSSKGNDGAHPYAGLLNVNGTLYGTTADGGTTGGCNSDGCGTVYAIAKGVEKVLHAFRSTAGADGATPEAGLINVNGTLYGTTENGGKYNLGTVFSITPGGTESVIYSFKGSPDGAGPVAGLIDVNGTLYGTTASGGSVCSLECGTVFSLNPSGAGEEVLHSFGATGDGSGPIAGLTDVGGTLYGTTLSGGGAGGDEGTIYSISAAGAEEVVYSFGQRTHDGVYPDSPLLDVGGTLYGTTRYGGSNACGGPGCGAIFSLTANGSEHVLYSFAGGTDGRRPTGAALTYSNGMLYGTTPFGGNSLCGGRLGCGVIFSADTKGVEKVLYTFGNTPDGLQPYASLLDIKGKLYGTTEAGGIGCRLDRFNGTQHCGVVFVLSP